MTMLQVTDAAVKAFVEERPGMTFMGLLATDAGFSDFLSGEGNLKVDIGAYIKIDNCIEIHVRKHKLSFMCKQVTGEANETQICEALRRYSEREGFVREALFHLFSLTHVMEKPRPDILKVNTHYCTWNLSNFCHFIKTKLVVPYLEENKLSYSIVLSHTQNALTYYAVRVCMCACYPIISFDYY